jgi:hypothetical protein
MHPAVIEKPQFPLRSTKCGKPIDIDTKKKENQEENNKTPFFLPMIVVSTS